LLGDNTWERSRPRGGRCRAVVFSSPLLLLWAAAAAPQSLIANDGAPETELSQNQARLFFNLRLKSWPDGTPVRVFVLPDDHPLHRRFAKQVLGLYPYQLRRVWDRQIFSGTGQAPTMVSTEAEMREGVASTPGAIGYLEQYRRTPGLRRMAVR
jgi:hypothetical protein